MALKYRKKAILAKIESTYGTDAAPSGAANAILVHDLSISPLEANVVSRDLVRPTLGNDLQIHVGAHVMVEFDVEMAGAGAAGTAPAYGPLLRACGMAETINAGSNVEYDPVSANEESATIHFHMDGAKHAMTGARGSFSLRLDPQGLAYYRFKFTGLWVDPTAAADPVPDFSAFQVPDPVTDSLTTLTLHGLTPKVAAFSFDQANEVFYDNLINEEVVDVNDRQPTGNVTIEAPDLATKNWFTTVNASTTGALQFVHGVTAGNIVQFDAPVVQALSPSYQERNGKTMLQMNLSFIPTDAGDDEFKITVK